MRSIAIHRSIDHLRRKGRREIVEIEAGDGQPADPVTPHTEMERRELRDRIVAAIGRLSRPQSETTVLFYINGYSQEEIARMQEVPLGTVKRRLHDARNRLKEEMMDLAEDVLRKNAPKEDLSERVFSLLCQYDRRRLPWSEGGKADWEAAQSELRRIGIEGVEGFVKAMEVPHALTRRFTLGMMRTVYNAATAGGTDRKEVLVSLVIQAMQDRNRKVRMWSGERLLHLDVEDERKRREFVPQVVSLLRDPTPRVRERAAYELLPWAADVPIEAAALALAEESDARVRGGMARLIKAIIAAQGQKEGDD